MAATMTAISRKLMLPFTRSFVRGCVSPTVVTNRSLR